MDGNCPQRSEGSRDRGTGGDPREWPAMHLTFLGHAGCFVETRYGSVLCDPWFNPAYFASWFPFPRNDRLSTELVERLRTPDYLYLSHLHRDHFDPQWLTEHVHRRARVLLPDFGIDLMARELAALGF